ncbi:MAG: hydrogenase accessory protein HypB [Candidatus Hydrothermarchaeota archaeon]|nr:MAG: hydrogenase accessory protein HypB [Candidatus Hydrothermarchaeota archaeon]
MHKISEVKIGHDLIKANKELAERNRRLLNEKKVIAFDIMGAIGSGKTSLIEYLIEELKKKGYSIGVIAGDVISEIDARRFKKHGIVVKGVNTGKECHLDAHLVEHALEELPLDELDVLFIENVGNLICPADFELGSHVRMVVVSVSEGDDIVAKHPMIFRVAHAVIVNKVDIASYVNCDVDKMIEDAKKINPKIKYFKTSVKTGEGLKDFLNYVEEICNMGHK